MPVTVTGCSWDWHLGVMYNNKIRCMHPVLVRAEGQNPLGKMVFSMKRDG